MNPNKAVRLNKFVSKIKVGELASVIMYTYESTERLLYPRQMKFEGCIWESAYWLVGWSVRIVQTITLKFNISVKFDYRYSTGHFRRNV